MNTQGTEEIETGATAEQRTKMLRKVQLLLAKADDPACTEEEAASFRAGAEKIMGKYRIAEEDARERGEFDVSTPIVVDVVVCPSNSDFFQSYWNMVYYAARHAGVRVRSVWARVDGSGPVMLIAKMVGYEMDVRYAEMIFLAAKVEFGSHLEPARIEGEEERMTAYRFRRAGRTRREISAMMWGEATADSVAKAQKIQRWYEEEAAARGEAVVRGRGVSRADYVKTYAESFCTRISQRLRRLRDGSDGAMALVAVKREGAVDDAFYEAFPELRPSTDVEPAAAYEDKRTDAQKKRDAAAVERMYAKDRARRMSAAGRAGWTAGTDAADAVRLDGSGGTKKLGE